MKVLITGASGFIGGALAHRFPGAAVLTRNAERFKETAPSLLHHRWDPMAGPPPAAAFQGVEAVFHLAGEPIASGRWTDKKKRKILESRIVGTQNLVEGIKASAPRPAVLVCASAIGFYGSRGDEILDETSPPGDDFLATVCRQWEEEAAKASEREVRVVSLRIGIVLGRDGGALRKMLPPFRLGLGGRLGSGKQWMSWVHLDDVVGLLCFAAEHPEASGAINAVSPAPVTNLEYTQTLGTLLRRPTMLPAPATALRLTLGEMATILLGSQRVLPRKAVNLGYRFRFPYLTEALRDLVRPEDSPPREKSLSL